MSAAQLIELLTNLYEVYDTVDDGRTCLEGAKRAKEGKNPFPASDKIEKRFDKLAKIDAELRAVASRGLGKPPQARVAMAEVADPKTRANAGKKFKDNLVAADAFVADGRKLLASLKAVEKEAKLRSNAARDVSKGLKKLVEAPLPDIGTVGKTEYFTLYQLFERAAGALGSIATNAGKAHGKVASELATIEEETDNLRVNLKTFGVK